MLMRFAHGPETIRLGDLEVRRLGFGAMRLTGPDVWGEPDDPAAAHAVLRRAVELGVNLIDTAWYYGPLVANRLIVEARQAPARSELGASADARRAA
jgi:pyridoxine 4-dehydrogenase